MLLIQVVTPQPRLRLEGLEGGMFSISILHVAFFAIYKGRQPFVFSGVGAPAVKVKIKTAGRRSRIGAVEAHDVVVLVFHPDAPRETTLSRARQRINVKNHAAYFAQKFLAGICELVVLTVKSVRVQINHLQKSTRQKIAGEKASNTEQQFSLAAVIDERLQLHALCQLRAPQKISVAIG